MSIVSLCKLVKKFSQTSSVTDQRTYKTPKIFKEEHLRFIDKTMASNPELTETQLAALIQDQFPSLKPSISTVKRARKELGWVSKKTRYCALISEVNCAKRVTWCEERKALKDLEFGDVIWTDECTVQLEPHRKRYFHKEGQPPRLTGKPKHAPKVNIWGGISHKGATSIVIFTGILTLLDTPTSLMQPCYLLSEVSMAAITGSSRTTILSIRVDGHNNTFKTRTLYGSKHLHLALT